MNSAPPAGIPEGVLRARAAAVWSRAEGDGVLEVLGPDAAYFLESQLPVRVLTLGVGGGAHTAYLDAKGRVTHDLLLLRLAEDRFWLLCRAARLTGLLEKLERHHIRERWRGEDRGPELAVWEIHGPTVPEILGRMSGTRVPIDPYSHLEIVLGGAPVRYVVDPWTGDAGGHLVFPRGSGAEVARALARGVGGEPLPEVDAAVLEVLRVEGGRFDLGADTDERTLLLELDRPEMVSHDKGCYLGQETVARVHARGHVNRRLMGLRVEGHVAPPSGTIVVHGESPAGLTRSSCVSPSLGGPVALAFLRTPASEPGTTVHLRMTEGLIAARVSALPLYRTPGPGEAAEALYRQGMDSFKQDRLEEALGYFERATLMNPHHLDAFESLGVTYERLGRLEEAARTMEALTEMAPDHVMAWSNLSRYRAREGRIEEAERLKGHVTFLVWKREAGEKAARRKAEEDEASRLARLGERIGLFEQVLALDPEDVVARFGLGKVLLDLGRWEEAVPHFREAVRLQPSYSAAYSHLGTCLARLGRREEASEVLRRGIEEAGRRGDLMPRREMERTLAGLEELPG